MDQEQEQTPEAPQPEVQPTVDAIQPTEVTEPVITPVEAFGPPVESIPQAESAPINPFAAPEVSEPAAIPVSTEPTPVVPPFAAAPQIEAVPPVFSTTPAPTPVVKKSHMGLIIGLVAGFVVLLVVAGVAGYIWFTNFYVSKADYQKAADTMNQLNTTETELSGNLSTSSSSSVSVAEMNAKIDQFNKKAQELGSLRAVQKDADVKKAYDAFEVNIQKEVTMLHAVAEFLGASDACKAVTTADTIASCVTSLRGVKSEGSPELKAYATVMADYLEAAAKGKSVSYTSAQTAFEKSATNLQTNVEQTASTLRDAINNKLK